MTVAAIALTLHTLGRKIVPQPDRVPPLSASQYSTIFLSWDHSKPCTVCGVALVPSSHRRVSFTPLGKRKQLFINPALVSPLRGKSGSLVVFIDVESGIDVDE